MKIFRFSLFPVLTAFFAALSWPAPLAADQPVKVHILYSSDAVGYHEPCG
jgi:hypothetical protein